MGELPLVRALFAELLKLDELDAQLPLAVLVNLHREQLRAPLEALERLLHGTYDEMTNSGLLPIVELIRDRWPEVRGKLFDDLDELGDLASELAWSDISIDTYRAAVEQSSPLVQRMLQHALEDWYPYETPALLHRLTWTDANLPLLLAMLELELGLAPQVGQMLLELAAETS